MILKILASLCIFKRKAVQHSVERYQILIKEYLFRDRNVIQLARFETVRDIECVYFHIGCQLDRFCEENNESILVPYLLSGLIHTDGKVYIPLDKIKNPDLIEYISALLNLLANVSLSRHTSHRDEIFAYYGLSFNHVFACMKNYNLSCKLRAAYLRFGRIYFIDVDSRKSLSSQHNRCFL